MSLRLFVDAQSAQPWVPGAEFDLPPGAARHVQVRRMQPGEALQLFNGQGGQWRACVTAMGRQQVRVRLEAHEPEAGGDELREVCLALGVPANERMDWLVEKAAELGAARIVPLLCERSVLRLDGERARKRQEHWQAVAVAAAEQSGATRLTEVAPIVPLNQWLQAAGGATAVAPAAPQRWLLSLDSDAPALARELAQRPATAPACVLSGPEGGLTPQEQAAAKACGFEPVTLGGRVLRAETAPLVALARLLA